MPDQPQDVFVLGLDLGQVSDFSALAIDHQTERPDRQKHHAIRYLQRWPLLTAYPGVVDAVVALVNQLPEGAVIVLCVDVTGVGRAVFDLFARARDRFERRVRLVPITLTGGNAVKTKQRGWTVAKADLVSSTQAALQTDRLKVVPSLEHAQTIEQELKVFKVKVNLSTANESFEAWRERDHDDLVLAVAMPVWFGERGMRRLVIFA
jgi:L-asparaginase/Glu-tRNA(Gln) amidotransferase subunit D